MVVRKPTAKRITKPPKVVKAKKNPDYLKIMKGK